jgi:hypothetical protein
MDKLFGDASPPAYGDEVMSDEDLEDAEEGDRAGDDSETELSSLVSSSSGRGGRSVSRSTSRPSSRRSSPKPQETGGVLNSFMARATETFDNLIGNRRDRRSSSRGHYNAIANE